MQVAGVSREHLAKAVNSLCASIKIEVPPVGADGRYVLHFADDIELRCFVHAGRAALEGVVRLLPEDERAEESVLKKLLQVSLGKARERGETLLLDEPSREIRLQRYLPADSDAGAGFIEVVEQFLNELDFWRRCATEGAQHNRAASPFGLAP